METELFQSDIHWSRSLLHVVPSNDSRSRFLWVSAFKLIMALQAARCTSTGSFPMPPRSHFFLPFFPMSLSGGPFHSPSSVSQSFQSVL